MKLQRRSNHVIKKHIVKKKKKKKFTSFEKMEKAP